MSISFPQRFNDEFQKELSAREMPDVPSHWIEKALDALVFASPMSLGVSAQDFNRLASLVPCSSDKRISLYDFALLSNNLEARTARELQMPLSEYTNLMLDVADESTRWNNITKDLRDEVTERVKQQIEMQSASENGAASAGSILKPVTGEA